MAKLPFVWELNNQGVISHAIGTDHRLKDLDQYAGEIQLYVQEKKYVLLESNEQTRTDFKKVLSGIGAKPLLATFEPEKYQAISDVLNIPLPDLYNATLLDIRNALRPPAKPKGSLDKIIEKTATRLGIPCAALERIIDLEPRLSTLHAEVIQTCIQDLLWEREGGNPLAKLFAAFDKAEEEIYHQADSNEILARYDSEADQYQLKIRNPRMVSASLPYLKEPALIAAGVLHFIAEPSLLTSYQQQGINVRRIQ